MSTSSEDPSFSKLQKDGTQYPILTHLNADTSWLLQLPLPIKAATLSRGSHFNVLIDPWLTGPQTDVASWFSRQWHATESKVNSIREVEELISLLEEKYNVKSTDHDLKEGDQQSNDSDGEKRGSPIDVILISHEFSDHCHKETLLEASPDIPVFATTRAAKLIRSWNHFETVREMPDFVGTGADWRKTSIEPLPDSIGIGRVPSQGSDFLYFHSAVLITFTGSTSGDQTRGIIYTPHGVSPKDIEHLPTANPPVDVLALLHGLHDVSIGAWVKGQFSNLGAHNGLRVQRLVRAKYWIGTHDEQKTAGGFVGFFLRRRAVTLKEALEKEAEEQRNRTAGLQTVEVVELGNGDSLVLNERS